MKKTVAFLVLCAAAATAFFCLNAPENMQVSGTRVEKRDIEINVNASGYVMADTETGQRLYVSVGVSEGDIHKIAEGSRAEITCVAVPGKVYGGVLSSISPYARQVSGLKSSVGIVDVQIDFTGDTPDIKPGYSADVKIIGSEIKDALLVPYESIVTKDGKSCVWVSGEKTAVLKEVETGYEDDFSTQITSGVEPGETVIVNPPWKPEAGEVKIGKTEAAQ